MSSLTKRVISMIDTTTQSIAMILRFFALSLVLIGFYNVLTRNLSSLIGVQLTSNSILELQIYLFNALFLLGCSVTMSVNKHVRVDIIYSTLSCRSKALIDLIGYLIFTIPFCLVSLRYALPWAYRSFNVFEVSDDPGGLPIYPLKAMIPTMLVLVLLQVVSECLKLVPKLQRQQPGRT